MSITTDQYLYSSTDQFFKELLLEIRNAKISIDLECFYLSHDEIGQTILFELIRASRNGIKVRILVDGLGSYEDIPWLKSQVNNTSIELKIYNPIPFQTGFLSNLLKGLYFINKRTHRKLYIIDKKTMFTGSINLSNDHFSFYNKDFWFDISFKLTGSYLKKVISSFENNWQKAHFKNTSIDKKKSYQSLIRKLRKAKTNIYILNPYFVPNKEINDELVEAKKRGVDVKIIVPERSDMKLFPRINSYFLQKLIFHGIKIYFFQPQILHSKLTIIDNTYFIGSSNWNFRSRLHDQETDFIIYKEDTKEKLMSVFNSSIIKSELLNEKSILGRHQFLNFDGFLYKLVKYWL
ncbi:MAG: phosphatidylserine/phosphatidylglycerophosphate/cardiolipin synthase family protein [Oligoflexia bacterium]|nr:phosphatidylserine/phosphatidylglycerophosphate/cardiolipin synthase family protein [Oligoflexia bacterium]